MQNYSIPLKAKKQLLNFIKAARQKQETLNIYNRFNVHPHSQQINQAAYFNSLESYVQQQNIELKSAFLIDERVKAPKKLNGQYDYPHSCIGYLESFFELGNFKKWAVGTGFLIKSGYVITAAHNLYDLPTKTKANEIFFYPAMNGKKEKNKAFAVEKFQFPENYSYEKSQEEIRENDYAILKLKSNNTLELYGNLQLKTYNQSLEDKEVMIFGYHLHKGEDFQWCQFGTRGIIQKIDNEQLIYTISTSQGQSGSPILLKNSKGTYDVIGIHTLKNYKIMRNQGIRINQQILIRINNWIRAFQIEQFMPKNPVKKDKSNQLWEQIQELRIQQYELQQCNQKISKEDISDDIISIFAKQPSINFKKLQVLDFRQLELSGNSLMHIWLCENKFKNLKQLNLSNNKIGNQGLQHLTKNQNVFKQLRVLHLMKNKIGDVGLQYLTRNKDIFKQLRILGLMNNRIGSQGVRHLTWNENVFVKLERLGLSNNKITAEGVDYLTKNENVFKQLRQLGIMNNKIGIEVLEYLTRNEKVFVKLKYLYLSGNKLEQNKEKQYKQVLKNHYKHINRVQL